MWLLQHRFFRRRRYLILLAGRILSETVIPDGGAASMAGNAMAVAETEFAFRMRVDLPARSTPYSVREVPMTRGIQLLGLAIESLLARLFP